MPGIQAKPMNEWKLASTDVYLYYVHLKNAINYVFIDSKSITFLVT